MADEWDVKQTPNEIEEWEVKPHESKIDHDDDWVINQPPVDITKRCVAGEFGENTRTVMEALKATLLHSDTSEHMEQKLSMMADTPAVQHARKHLANIQPEQRTLSDILTIAFIANEGICLRKKKTDTGLTEDIDFEAFEKEMAQSA